MDKTFELWDEFMESDTPLEEFIRFELLFKKNMTRENVRHWLLTMEQVIDITLPNVSKYLSEIQNGIKYVEPIEVKFPEFDRAAVNTPEHQPIKQFHPLAPIRPIRTDSPILVSSPQIRRQLSFPVDVDDIITPPPIKRYGISQRHSFF